MTKTCFKLSNEGFKFSKTGDFFSSNGANHARAVPINNVSTSPTSDVSLGYDLLGCILITKRT
jgi:hypothetical protein